MIIYLAAVSCVITYFVFQSHGIDYRLIAVGSLIPFSLDEIIGHVSLGHSFFFPVAILLVIMIGTVGQKRLLRRRLLCIVIGIFLSDVLEGTFLHEKTWWWPLTSHHSADVLSLTPSIGVWIVRDVIGLIALYILIALGDLYKKDKWKKFLHDGRI